MINREIHEEEILRVVNYISYAIVVCPSTERRHGKYPTREKHETFTSISIRLVDLNSIYFIIIIIIPFITSGRKS